MVTWLQDVCQYSSIRRAYIGQLHRLSYTLVIRQREYGKGISQRSTPGACFRRTAYHVIVDERMAVMSYRLLIFVLGPVLAI